MAALFGYDHPDRFTVAGAIRDSLLVSDIKPFGGIPDELWVDHGKELLSAHVYQLASEMGIMLQPCAPHQPQLKGIVERFFGTLNTRLWSTLPGYVASNTVERNPKAKAGLTLKELVDKFWAFIARYHAEVHSETGQTPLDYWNERCFAEPADLRTLDILLMEPERRRVINVGIKYNNRVYWHSELAGVVGEDVIVRVAPSYAPPDEIEVFHDGQWLCTAFATDSETGKAVTRRQIAAAQHAQRERIKNRIGQAREALKKADREIEEKAKEPLPDKPQGSPQAKDKPKSKKPKGRRGRKADFLDSLAGLDEDSLQEVRND
jgi:putative transposase